MPTRQQHTGKETGKEKGESTRKGKAQGGDGQASPRKSKAQGGDGQASARKGKAQSRKVNLNTASEQELRAIEGLGPQHARQLVRYRKEHGAFEDFSDLENVEGFDSQLIDTIRRQATV